jgi:hypothetical protein
MNQRLELVLARNPSLGNKGEDWQSAGENKHNHPLDGKTSLCGEMYCGKDVEGINVAMDEWNPLDLGL